MNNVLNLSLVEGRLTHDPDLLYTKNGNALCKFSIAVNSQFKSGDKIIPETSFISVDSWNKVAESCSRYLKKGTLVRVRGRLKQNSWEGKDGLKKSKITLEASGVDFLSLPREKDQKEVKEITGERVPF